MGLNYTSSLKGLPLRGSPFIFLNIKAYFIDALGVNLLLFFELRGILMLS